MKNPLRKRIPRELKGEFGKYLVVFILMVTTIGMVSGFLVADGSMIQAYNEGFEKYNIEDGNFRTGERLYRGQREAIEEEGVKVYENYYIEDTLTNGSTMRFFKNRTDVNKVCLMDGKLAEKTGEIAIDRMYADNNDLTDRRYAGGWNKILDGHRARCTFRLQLPVSEQQRHNV